MHCVCDVVIVGLWDTKEESGIFIEKFHGDRGEDLVDFVPMDKSQLVRMEVMLGAGFHVTW